MYAQFHGSDVAANYSLYAIHSPLTPLHTVPPEEGKYVRLLSQSPPVPVYSDDPEMGL